MKLWNWKPSGNIKASLRNLKKNDNQKISSQKSMAPFEDGWTSFPTFSLDISPLFASSHPFQNNVSKLEELKCNTVHCNRMKKIFCLKCNISPQNETKAQTCTPP